MSEARFPWFHCYQTKLLGALSGMEVDQGYLYCIVLFRIYEVSGPCTDSIEVLARRCGMRKARCQRALDWLLDKKKLYRVEGGLMNHFAADTVATRKRIIAGSQNLDSRPEENEPEKRPTNQRGATPPGATPAGTDRDRDLERTHPLSGGGTPAVQKARRNAGTTLPADWQPDEDLFQYGINLGLTRREIERAAATMKSWAAANAHRPIARKASWKAAFEGWLRRDAEKFGRRGPSGAPNGGGGNGPRGRPSMMEIATGATDADESEPDR